MKEINETEWQGLEADRIDKKGLKEDEALFKALFDRFGISKDEFEKLEWIVQENLIDKLDLDR
jgi:hypothetical protein